MAKRRAKGAASGGSERGGKRGKRSTATTSSTASTAPSAPSAASAASAASAPSAPLVAGSDGTWADVRVYVVPLRIGAVQGRVLRNRVAALGGAVHDFVSPTTNVIVANLDVSELIEWLRQTTWNESNTPQEEPRFHKLDYLVDSLKQQSPISPHDFRLHSDEEYVAQVKMAKYQQYRREHQRRADVSGTRTVALSVAGSDKMVSLEVSDELAKKRRKKARVLASREFFACQGAKATDPKGNNMLVSRQLNELADMYKAEGDQWREYTTRNAARRIAKLPFALKSGAEATKLPKIGKKLGAKIQEILDTGSLRKLENFKADDKVVALELFQSIWGVGAATARKWVHQRGWRTLRDVRDHADSLTTNQAIGLKYYHDIKSRIPRSEVMAIEARVREVATAVVPGVALTVCGSYRRGRLTCGDIDVLFTHPDDKVAVSAVSRVVPALHDAGLLTHDLTSDNRGDSYMGLCRLGPDSLHRRIDLKSFKQSEYGCALLYFSGSEHFCRSVRTWARRQGYSLSERALVRRFSRDTKSDLPIPGLFTEEAVFQALGLKYVPPEERDI
ncbi:poll protein [Thecamonas trahens ATCC 50062]|uniref:DNA polymerase n=1 Tax=Thecamonas trahens ATCC 50062 TaxID=461836 RepID=A0A0L0DBR4_THETB|nr:poll protein [Thecamonas trahens ATCC 50062]KNC49782.1 poll protein [Thecamonas trahens ATCC 50062]|eukprot:XP_013757566.1 poll protein [Thecamonas trahens ATCC 50062]